jgi:hypothetical protein
LSKKDDGRVIAGGLTAGVFYPLRPYIGLAPEEELV